MSDQLSGPLTMNLGVLRGDENGMEVRLNYRYPVTRTFDSCGPTVEAAFAGAGFTRAYQQHKPRIYICLLYTSTTAIKLSIHDPSLIGGHGPAIPLGHHV